MATAFHLSEASKSSIECIKAAAEWTLQNDLTQRWRSLKADRSFDRTSGPEAFFDLFERYAEKVFDAYAKEYLRVITNVPEFLTCLEGARDEVMDSINGPDRLWGRTMQKALSLSNYYFYLVPGRRGIWNAKYFIAHGWSHAIMVLDNRVIYWKSFAWAESVKAEATIGISASAAEVGFTQANKPKATKPTRDESNHLEGRREVWARLQETKVTRKTWGFKAHVKEGEIKKWLSGKGYKDGSRVDKALREAASDLLTV